MSEQEHEVQATLSFGDLNFTIRTDSVEKAASYYADIEKAADELSKSMVAIKQAYVGNAVAAGVPVSTPASGGMKRSAAPATSAPASANGNCPGNEFHEPMPWKDTRYPDGTPGRTKAGEIMKFDLYCSFDPGKGADDWKKKCAGVAINPR